MDVAYGGKLGIEKGSDPRCVNISVVELLVSMHRKRTKDARQHRRRSPKEEQSCDTTPRRHEEASAQTLNYGVERRDEAKFGRLRNKSSIF